ncbi:hypothetical protein ACRCD7_10405 [Aliarcobacter sp. ERUVET-7]|uniref:hypothetical protein n=1 Tax=Aliarcobacter sp. ERUVET-7 TaxID=3429683 RepID=UPI003D6AC1C2
MQNELDFLKYKDKVKKSIIDYLKSTQNQLLIDLKVSLINQIFKNINQEDNFKNNKIYLNMPLWIKLHNKDIFRKNALTVNNLVKDLKNKSFISKVSRDYPKNQVLFSINPLQSSFLNLRLSKFDEVINLRNSFLSKLENIDFFNDKDNNVEYEINLFIFFKLFLIDKIPNTYFRYFNRRNIIYTDNNIIFVIKEDEENGFIPLKTIVFDKFSSSLLIKIFPQKIKSLFDANEYLFSKDYEFYNDNLQKFCKEINLSPKDIKNAICFEYQLNNSPLTLTLNTNMNYPNINLHEIEKLYPNSVNKEFLQIESDNYEIYRNVNNDVKDSNEEIIEDNDDEMDLETELSIKFDVYEKFKQIRRVPNKTNQIESYVKKWNDFMSMKKNHHDRFVPIYNHIRYLLDKLLSRNISIKTLQNYLQIIFHFCFDILVKVDNVEDAIKNIDYKLKNSDINPNVQIHYQKRILLFFKEEYNLSFKKINSVINYNRSVIFEDELDKVIQKLVYIDKKLYKDEISINRRAVFAIIAYYSGLRKGELFSRRLKDFDYIGDRKFYINVNLKGINLINKYYGKRVVSLKNSNAKRAFEFEISNIKHLNIVKKYYYNIEKHGKVRFLFPDNTKNLDISKYRVMNISKINEINSILYDTTKRYTVIHSFRHTYATNEIKKILDKKDKRIEDIFDLIYRIGHGDPETTIRNYSHLSLLKIIE